MREPDDGEDNITSNYIICRELDLNRTDVWLICKLNLLLRQLNFVLVRIYPSNFNLILI